VTAVNQPLNATRDDVEYFSLGGDLPLDGQWHHYTTARVTTHRGDIWFAPQTIPGARFELRLRNLNAPGEPVFSNTVTWTPDDLQAKVVATDVLAGTRYAVDALAAPPATFRGTLWVE
jgi:hypothetical protein